MKSQTIREQIVAFINKFHARNGYAPTVREVADAVGLYSTSTAHHHLMSLAKEGRIAYEPMMPRTLRVTKDVRR